MHKLQLKLLEFLTYSTLFMALKLFEIHVLLSYKQGLIFITELHKHYVSLIKEQADVKGL